MAGLSIETILEGRSCDAHRCCPIPCVQCAGEALSRRDQVKGGYKGNLPVFEAEVDDDRTDAVVIAEAEIKATVSGWGRQKQLHAVGISFYR